MALIGSVPARGRIDETLEQCVARYGEPSRLSDDRLGFQKSGMVLLVLFYGDKADCIVFQKSEKDKLGNGQEFSKRELEQLMNVNGGGREWKRLSLPLDGEQWITLDGERLARYERFTHFLTIMTNGHLAREAAAIKEQEDKGLKGF